jgi:hypothetical protein
MTRIVRIFPSQKQSPPYALLLRLGGVSAFFLGFQPRPNGLSAPQRQIFRSRLDVLQPLLLARFLFDPPEARSLLGRFPSQPIPAATVLWTVKDAEGTAAARAVGDVLDGPEHRGRRFVHRTE